MTVRPLSFLLFPLLLLLWECATPPPAPLPVPETPRPVPLPPVVGPDDDHRSVSREEFHASAWGPLPSATGWKPLPNGAMVTLGDGREVSLTFVAPAVVRWWVPAGVGEKAVSPAAVYPAPGVTVRVKELDGVLQLDTPGLGLRWRLADLSWTLLRGDKTVVHTVDGPRVSGRRLNQAFAAADAARWVGPGLEVDRSAKFWTEAGATADPLRAPALSGVGGPVPFVMALDNSYQTYTRLSGDEATVGALNGGLDLLVAASPVPAAAVEALSALLGRPTPLPTWVHGNALVLPETEKGAFVRKAKLSVQTAVGARLVERATFQALVSAAWTDPLPDLTRAEARTAWLSSVFADPLPLGAGVRLPAVAARADWNTTFADEGRSTLLSGMSNRLPALLARTVADAWSVRNLGTRPVVLSASGGLGSLRWALPEIAVTGQRTLPAVLAAASTGLGTPAVRLDLSSLGSAETRKAAFQSLLAWLMAPVLILDWGKDPAGLWAALPDADQKRLKAVLERRSQFKPLFAQLAREATQGKPQWSPVWFAAPADPLAWAVDDAFLLGGNLLVAPVPEGAAGRSVYLPGPGVWFDFWSGEEFGGGKAYEVEARVDRPQLYVRGGSFVPMRDAEVFDDRDVYNPLTLHVFPGGRGSGEYYLDDGLSLPNKPPVAWETRIVFDFSQKEMTLDHESLSTTARLRPDPYLLYRLHNVFRPRQVKIDGKAIPLYGDSWGITDTDRSAAWYESDHSLLIKTFRPERNQSLVMSF